MQIVLSILLIKKIQNNTIFNIVFIIRILLLCAQIANKILIFKENIMAILLVVPVIIAFNKNIARNIRN